MGKKYLLINILEFISIIFIIGIPLIEIYFLITVGGVIGAFNTIFLIFFTAVTGIYFARLSSSANAQTQKLMLVK